MESIFVLVFNDSSILYFSWVEKDFFYEYIFFFEQNEIF